MRLIFVNRFFFPDESATSIMLSDLVFALGEAFPDRHVITSRAQYAGGTGRPPALETVQGVEVHRLPALEIGNASLIGRLVNFIGFYLFGTIAALRYVRRGDVIICLTDPPLVSVVMGAVAAIKGASLVNWVQDIFPETARELGFRAGSGLPGKFLRGLRDRSWSRARKNVAIGRVMADYLRQCGAPPSTVTVIGNWAKEEELCPLPVRDNALRRQWGFSEEDCVIGYSGNLGRAHDASTMIEAIKLLDAGDRHGLRFLFIGGGAKLAEVHAAARQSSPGRIVCEGYQPMERLRESLSVPDVHWLSLYPPLEPFIVPSKFYGAAAVGRPIIFIGDPEGELGRLIRDNDCGRAFAIGESRALADFLNELHGDPELRRQLGQNARTLVETRLRRGQSHAAWEQLLHSLRA